jgi:hypothetical protein
MGGGQSGNRQDNRQRGNAAQLLEKYKNMARDAQLAGDRVQTEYYLQFADHYFRVLSENRARFEDQRRGRDDDVDDEDGEEELIEAGEEISADERPQREERPQRQDRGERFNRRDRQRRGDGEGREDRAARESAEDEARQPNGGGETIPFDVLPPAISREENTAPEASEEEPRRPRRRARAPRPADGEEEIAPAA